MTLADAALAYADRGWLVFPLQPHGKAPLTAHGFRDATGNPAVVRQWWTRRPDANIGVATGPGSDLLVVDLDGDQGFSSWAKLEAANGAALTLEQETSSGVHLLFAYPADPAGVKIGNTAGKLGVGIDTRGLGGYIVAAPSVHPSGSRYRWCTGEREPAPCPRWLLKLLMPPPRSRPPVRRLRPDPGQDPRVLARFHGLLDTIGDAKVGERNTRLHWCACRLAELREAGAPAQWAELLVQAAVDVGLDRCEASRTVASGLRGADR